MTNKTTALAPPQTSTSIVPPARPKRPWTTRAAQLLTFWGAIASIVFFGVIRRDHLILGEVLVFCFALYFLFKFPDIAKLKVGGVEVELERLERATANAGHVADEAKATAEQLRQVSAVFGKVAMETMAMSNRFGGMSIERKIEVRDHMLETLRHAGCSETDLANARELLDRTLRWDMAGRVLNAVDRLKRTAGNEAVWAESKRLLGTDFKAASAKEIRAFVVAQGIEDEAVLRRMAELEIFDKAGSSPDTAKDDSEDERLLSGP